MVEKESTDEETTKTHTSTTVFLSNISALFLIDQKNVIGHFL